MRTYQEENDEDSDDGQLECTLGKIRDESEVIAQLIPKTELLIEEILDAESRAQGTIISWSYGGEFIWTEDCEFLISMGEKWEILRSLKKKLILKEVASIGY